MTLPVICMPGGATVTVPPLAGVDVPEAPKIVVVSTDGS
jgi:hypothetical protein